MLGEFLKLRGSAFQTDDACTEKALSPNVLNFATFDRIKLVLDDLNVLGGLYLTIISDMYLGARLLRHLKTSKAIL